MKDVVQGSLKLPIPRRNMRVMLDIDGTITHSPDFFKMFSVLFSEVAEIHVVTARNFEKYHESTVAELQELGIQYHKLAFTYEKAQYVKKEGIKFVFDDMDEFFVHMPADVRCFKVRETDNFDWKSMRWIYDDYTGVHLEDLP